MSAQEHPYTAQVAYLLGATPHYQEGNNGGLLFPIERPDVVVMPSGMQICGPRELLRNISTFGMNTILRSLAAAEEFAIESGEQHIDWLGNGSSVSPKVAKPSPLLLKYYMHPDKYQS